MNALASTTMRIAVRFQSRLYSVSIVWREEFIIDDASVDMTRKK